MRALSDTAPEAFRVLVEIHRRMPPGKKWLRLGSMWQEARMLHAAGARLREPGATGSDIQRSWLAAQLGPAASHLATEALMDQDASNLQILREVLGKFTALAIPYALGGSMASSVYGVDRYTRDADITVEPFPDRVDRLLAGFGPGYYVSPPAIEEALQRRTSFNIIHTGTGFKVDVFIRKEEPFDQSAMSRRRPLELPDVPGQPIVFHSAEDTILYKLKWYRTGNEISDRQWTDVLGVLRTQAGRLDESYLDRWAADQGVTDLLGRARGEAADPGG